MINEQHLPDKDCVVMTVVLDGKVYEMGVILTLSNLRDNSKAMIKNLASNAILTIEDKKPEALGK